MIRYHRNSKSAECLKFTNYDCGNNNYQKLKILKLQSRYERSVISERTIHGFDAMVMAT